MKKKRIVAIIAVLFIAMLPAAIFVYAEALTDAAERNDVAEIRRLIAEGEDVNDRGYYNKGWTVLMHAAEKNALDIVKTLIAAGADVNMVDNKGKTAFVHAEEYKAWSVASFLKKAGAKSVE